MLLYACGVVFPALAVPLSWRIPFFVNPLAQIIEDMRHALVTPDAPWTFALLGGGWLYLVPLTLSIVLFIAGLALFTRLAPLFAENL
jgi:ABC-2 type transport system permease protein